MRSVCERIFCLNLLFRVTPLGVKPSRFAGGFTPKGTSGDILTKCYGLGGILIENHCFSIAFPNVKSGDIVGYILIFSPVFDDKFF